MLKHNTKIHINKTLLKGDKLVFTTYILHFSVTVLYITCNTDIHVIFSSSQIGRFGISQREIGVSDREFFA